jgi:ferredoxin-type protein NapH
MSDTTEITPLADPRAMFLERLAMAAVALGLLAFTAHGFSGTFNFAGALAAMGGLVVAGALLFILSYYLRREPGIRNDGIWRHGWQSRGLVGYGLGVFITGFYVVLYWYPEKLVHLIALTDGLSQVIRGGPADSWFLYGTLYTFAALLMGVRAMVKYRHSRYQVFRVTVIMVAQLMLGYLIPAFMKLLHQPEFYFGYFWPLKPEYLFPTNVAALKSHPGGIGFFLVLWGAIMTFIATPILTYFFGKRWYCSWVCGCGGLANTLGDPWRQLSDKSLGAWKFERVSIHLVLVLIVALTGLLWANSFWQGQILGDISMAFSRWYGFFIGALFSGVIGVGFYPILGTRVWCRFGCPMAAYLGLLQKYFSRFRITTNGGQCISCGNCSMYCEMGIDVRAYAQRGEDIVRASCVGCGICSTVCPRGVLNLENGQK